MKTMVCSVAVWLLIGSTIQAQAPKLAAKPGDLAIQAREILRRHCAECHRGGPPSRADLDVLDHARLLDPARRLVIPLVPQRSRLLELIEDGSMPQKNGPRVPPAEREILRAWVDAGAPSFFPSHSESYVLARVLDDARNLEPKDRPYSRYVSLNHFLDESEPRTALDVYRAGLNRLMQQIGKPGGTALTPIEPTETVYRLDLRALGWNEPILTGTKERAPLKPIRLNRFDLLLLQYPYAVLPERSAEYADLGREFLEPSQQVRPIAYVRGDWLIDAVLPLAGQSAAGDSALEKVRQLYQAPINLAAAQAQLDPTKPADDLKKLLLSPMVEKLAPLASGGTVSIDVWEKHFDRVVRLLDLGTPVIPLDSAAFPEYQPENGPVVKLSVQDPLERKPQTRFKPRGQMQLVVETDRSLYIELIWMTSDGKAYLVNRKSRMVKAGDALRFGPETGQLVEIDGKKERVYTLGDEVGKEQVILFACEVGQLAEEKDFPEGEVFRAPAMPERVVHPFYYNWYDSKAPRRLDPGRMIKRTVDFEVQK